MELAVGTASAPAQKRSTVPASEPLYRPLSFFMARAPLLPLEAYLQLGDEECRFALAGDGLVRRALAVGSASLVDAFEKHKRKGLSQRDADRMRAKLLRYQIRMSTRPTPYGLFAGVALGAWGERTDFAIHVSCARTRTRPDMEWLMKLVFAAEADKAVRRRLDVRANPLVVNHAGRLSLAERTPNSGDMTTVPVSVRATSVAKQTLLLARQPIAFGDLVERLRERTPSASVEKVEKLLNELCDQTFLLTDLRPPLTIDDPASYVAEKLAGIPEAAEALKKLNALRSASQAWDESPGDWDLFETRLIEAGIITDRSQQPPVQADMAMDAGGLIHKAVAEEAVRAAEILLRLSPFPFGSPGLASYRQAFINRYGGDREVPLLELLDPNRGLGPMMHAHAHTGPDPNKAGQRARILTELACVALRDHLRVVELDEKAIQNLETNTPNGENAPDSLDINFLVAARSAHAVDEGDFRIVIGPNLGAIAAGRNLGRFSHLLGQPGLAALQEVAGAETANRRDVEWAELVYLPISLRMANVVIRPQVRPYEVILGVSAGVAETSVIPLDELVVGVRQGRFHVRWSAVGKQVLISSGHMLTYHNAPAVGRFLSEVSHDNRVMFSSFDWGPAESFPYLPRVQTGRIVLREAQWRIQHGDLNGKSLADFCKDLARWRQAWSVPRYVCLSVGDNRLILDLDQSDQRKELHAEVQKLQPGESIIVQEIFPEVGKTWLTGPGGTYYSELIASLTLRSPPKDPEPARKGPESGSNSQLARANPSWASPVDDAHRKPPGSEWLFVKLYCPRNFENDVLADSLPPFANNAIAAGLADSWFFIRYADPDTHIRLRFHGNPERLKGLLLPHICEWAGTLMASELCAKFSFDTYEQEIERFGGEAGMTAAEAVFFADSRCCAELVRHLKAKHWPHDVVALLALTVDDLLAALGADEADRLRWYRTQTTEGGREIGADYRERKNLLRSLLGRADEFLAGIPHGPSIASSLASRRAALQQVGAELRTMVEESRLTQPLDALYASYVHLHLNRVVGSEHAVEQRLLSLLLRTRDSLEKAPLHRSA
jgi:lantibiotic biosynthesis protein